MAIRQRGSGLQIDVTVRKDGHQLRHREKFAGSLDDAKAREAAIRADLLADREIKPATVSGSVCKLSSSDLLLEASLEFIWQRYWSVGGQARTVRSCMKTCIDYFGADRDIRTITTDEADAYVEWCKAQGWAESTIKKKCHPMTKMFTHYSRRGNVQNPPFFETPKIRNNERTRVITDEEFAEVQRLLRGPYDHFHARGDSPAGDDWADFFQFLWDTGVRPSEAAKLKSRNLVGDRIYVAETKTDNPRTLPLTQAALAAFRRQHQYRGELPFEWAHSQYAKAWGWCRDQMGLGDEKDFVPYALRHSCATRLYDKTRDLRLVQKWLGHKNIQMTLRYAKLQPHDLDNARDMLEAL